MHIWTCGHSSVLPTTNTHTGIWLFRSVQTDLWKKSILRVFKHTSSPSPPSQHALRHGGVISAGTIGLNVVKMSRMSVLGQREGGLSLGSDAASKSKLKRCSIFHHFCRWRLGSSFMWLHVNRNQLLKGNDQKTHTFESAVDRTTTNTLRLRSHSSRIQCQTCFRFLNTRVLIQIYWTE